MGQWCWAAVTASVVAFRQSGNAKKWTQCAIASAELNQTCCGLPRPSTCDQQNTLQDPLTRVGMLRGNILGNPIPPASVAAELNAGLPTLIRVRWRTNGGGHFLAICGIRQQPNGIQYALTDPIYGQSLIMERSLLNSGYQSSGGDWTHSYVVN